MAPLGWSAAALERAAAAIAVVLQDPLVQQAADSLRTMMIAAPGLERPVSAADTGMLAGQTNPAMPDADDLVADGEPIAGHIEMAQQRAHPLADAVEARADLRSAVEWLVIYSPPGSLDRERAHRLKFMGDVAASLQPVDERLRSLRSRPARRLLRSTGRKPSVALWAALIRAMGWPDTTVVDGLICGFPTVGHYPETGIFRRCDRPAAHAFECLDHRGHNARLEGVLRRPAQSEAPSVRAALEETYRLTRKEVEQGLMRGPFYSTHEVDADLGVAPPH